MKALTVAVATCAVLGSSLAVSPANAASPKLGVYFHGGVQQATFASKAGCAPHAAALAAMVNARAKSGYRFMPLVSGLNTAENNQNAHSCFPMMNGRWTYIGVYAAPLGHPIYPSDKYLPNTNAGGTPAFTFDDASYWMVHHYVTKPANSWTQAQCVADMNKTLSAVKSTSWTAPGLVNQCVVQGTDRWYSVDYYVGKNQSLLGEPYRGIEIANSFPVSANWYYNWSAVGYVRG